VPVTVAVRVGPGVGSGPHAARHSWLAPTCSAPGAFRQRASRSAHRKVMVPNVTTSPSTQISVTAATHAVAAKPPKVYWTTLLATKHQTLHHPAHTPRPEASVVRRNAVTPAEALRDVARATLTLDIHACVDPTASTARVAWPAIDHWSGLLTEATSP